MVKKFDKQKYQVEYWKKNKLKLKKYQKEYRKKNKEILKKKGKIYQKKNRLKIKTTKKKYYQKNVKEILKKKKIYRNVPKNIERQKKYMKEYSIKNRDNKKKYNTSYYIKNKDKIIEQVSSYYKKNKSHLIKKGYQLQKKKTEQDPIFRLLRNLRRRVSVALERVQTRKQTNTYELIGCSVQYLVKHIESQFLQGMSWKNRKDWHIDHIVPVNYFVQNFDIKLLEVQKVCFNYRNLRPLWSKENLGRSKLEFGKISTDYKVMINSLKV